MLGITMHVHVPLTGPAREVVAEAWQAWHDALPPMPPSPTTATRVLLTLWPVLQAALRTPPRRVHATPAPTKGATHAAVPLPPACDAAAAMEALRMGRLGGMQLDDMTVMLLPRGGSGVCIQRRGAPLPLATVAALFAQRGGAAVGKEQQWAPLCWPPHRAASLVRLMALSRETPPQWAVEEGMVFTVGPDAQPACCATLSVLRLRALESPQHHFLLRATPACTIAGLLPRPRTWSCVQYAGFLAAWAWWGGVAAPEDGSGWLMDPDAFGQGASIACAAGDTHDAHDAHAASIVLPHDMCRFTCIAHKGLFATFSYCRPRRHAPLLWIADMEATGVPRGTIAPDPDASATGSHPEAQEPEKKKRKRRWRGCVCQ